MKVIVLCEGKTEDAFKPTLIRFLNSRYLAAGKSIKKLSLDFKRQDGGLPHGDKLKRMVDNYLREKDTKAVIALTDVYPAFTSPQNAKKALSKAVGSQSNFYSHVACYDFESWLLPYWDTILARTGVNRKPFGNYPEAVNHSNPPAHRLIHLYQTAKPKPLTYRKPVEAAAILRNQDLTVAAAQCPELKAFLNTVLTLARLPIIK